MYDVRTGKTASLSLIYYYTRYSLWCSKVPIYTYCATAAAAWVNHRTHALERESDQEKKCDLRSI